MLFRFQRLMQAFGVARPGIMRSVNSVDDDDLPLRTM